ncbi:beta-carotene hydroxylase [Pantoea sp. Aalb]|uniref:beta-carotene hydroxylase n=1 Tax=Pantoea sp. Aalb TaxID=2576762 RepID=UPI001F4442D5
MMEIIATLTHKYIMHGCGWNLHLSHHKKHTNKLELNDIYAIFFSFIAIILIYLGIVGKLILELIGIGITTYGILYFIFHDGIVHQRWTIHYTPNKGYLKRIYIAHLMHHTTNKKEGCISFGFIYAPPILKLKQKLIKINEYKINEDVAKENKDASVD